MAAPERACVLACCAGESADAAGGCAGLWGGGVWICGEAAAAVTTCCWISFCCTTCAVAVAAGITCTCCCAEGTV